MGGGAVWILLPAGSRYSLHANKSSDSSVPTQRKYLRIGINAVTPKHTGSSKLPTRGRTGTPIGFGWRIIDIFFTTAVIVHLKTPGWREGNHLAVRLIEIILAGAMLSASLSSVAQDVAVVRRAGPDIEAVATLPAVSGPPEGEFVAERSTPEMEIDPTPERLSVEISDGAPTSTSEPDDISDRDYLVKTARPGDTMSRQGPELAIGRLHPGFVIRLAGAIREARDRGLPSAGISSAYRPPAFGIGGFSDKFKSLHTYGLAVDMNGIGGPGTAEASLWHQIAARHGVICPYGAVHRSEWNHCQATPLRHISAENPLRGTVTAEGPLSLEEMFEVGTSFMDETDEVPDPWNKFARTARTLLCPSFHSTDSLPPSVTKWVIAKPPRAAPRRSSLATGKRLISEEKQGRRLGTNSFHLSDLRVKRGKKSFRRVAGWNVNRVARDDRS
jgi:hypothetical protein